MAVLRTTEAVTPNVADCTLTSKYDWNTKIAYATCLAESHGNTNAVGDVNTKYVSCGLMQIRTLPGRPTCEQLKNPQFNMDYAYRLYKAHGFQPWSAFNNGSYLKYMK